MRECPIMSEAAPTTGPNGPANGDKCRYGDRRGTVAYVAVLAALALALVAAWAHHAGGVPTDLSFLVGAAAFCGLLLLTSALPVRVAKHTEISAEGIVATLAVAALGPLWAVAASLPVALLAGRSDPLRGAYEASRRTVEACVAGAVFSAVGAPLLAGGSTSTAAAVYATLAAGSALLATNQALDAGLLKAKYRQGLGRSWEENVASYLVPDALTVLTAALAVLALLSYGPVAAVVLVAGSVASQALVLRSREHARRSAELQAENLSLKRALSGAGATFGSLVAEALGRKDGRADRRAAATAVYAADLAREMGLGDERTEEVRLAGLLHDVGMVFLPEELLLAEGSPNSVAQRELAEHAALGEAALSSVPGYEEMARWVRWHHERPDGRGYPDKLRGPWIPLEAKILAVAQAHTYLVLDGPRRTGVASQEARERLVKGMDTEFDGQVVKVFLRILETETEGYRMADDDRFVLPGRAARARSAGQHEAPGPNSAPVSWSILGRGGGSTNTR